MKITVGNIQQKLIFNKGITAENIADFLDSLLILPTINRKHYEAINDLRIFYTNHSSQSFIEDDKFAIKHYQQNKKLVIKALKAISEESKTKNKVFIDSILENFHYSDKALNKGGFLGKLIRLSQEPD